MRGLAWLGLAVALAFSAALVGSTMGSVLYHTAADEGYYLHHAYWIAREGPAAFPRLFQEYLHGKTENGLYPSPLRFSSLLIGAAAVRIGGASFHTLSMLSLAAFLLMLVILFCSLRRAFADETALWTVVLVSAAPLHLALARCALTDTLASMLMLASLCLFAELVDRGGGRRWWGMSLLLAVTYSTKGSTLVLIPIFLFFLLARWLALAEAPPLAPAAWLGRRGRFPWREGLFVGAVPLAVVAFVSVWAAGGLEVVVQTARFGQAAYGSFFAREYLSGPWYRYVVDFLLVSPWVTLLYLLWLGMAAGGTVSGDRARFWTLLPVLFLACAAFFPLRNVRYAVMLEVPLRIGVVLLLTRLLAAWPRRDLASLAMGGMVAWIVWGDLETFSRFVQIDLYEPTSFHLLHVRQMLPR